MNLIIEKITNYYLDQNNQVLDPDILFCQEFFIDKKVVKTKKHHLVLAIKTSGLHQKEVARKYLKKLSSVFKKILDKPAQHLSLKAILEKEHDFFLLKNFPLFFRTVIHNVTFIIIPKKRTVFRWGGFGHQSLYKRKQRALSRIGSPVSNTLFFEQKLSKVPQSITIGFELPHNLHKIKESPKPMIELLFKKKKPRQQTQKQEILESFHLEYTSSISAPSTTYFDSTVSGSLSPLVDPVTLTIKTQAPRTMRAKQKKSPQNRQNTHTLKTVPTIAKIEKKQITQPPLAELKTTPLSIRASQKTLKKKRHDRKHTKIISKKIKIKKRIQKKKTPKKTDKALLKKIQKLEKEKKRLLQKLQKLNKKKNAKKVVFSVVESFFLKKSAKLSRSKKIQLKKKIRKTQKLVWKSVRYALQNFKTKKELKFFVKKYAKKLDFGTLVLKSLEKIKGSKRATKKKYKKIQALIRTKTKKKKEKKKFFCQKNERINKKRGFATDRYFRDFKGDVDFYRQRLRRLKQK